MNKESWTVNLQVAGFRDKFPVDNAPVLRERKEEESVHIMCSYNAGRMGNVAKRLVLGTERTHNNFIGILLSN